MTPGKRILAVYDMFAQPYSLGDFILFLQTIQATMQDCGAQGVELCFIVDHDEHVDPVLHGFITRENSLYHLFCMFPLILLHGRIAALHVLRSKDEFLVHYQANKDAYAGFFPAPEMFHRYMTFDAWPALAAHYGKRGSIDFLSPPRYLRDWAASFVRVQAWPRLPVTVNLRNNPRYAASRNADIEFWLDFLNQSQATHEISFVLICGQEEIDDRFRKIPNLVLAKDHHTGPAEDTALIDAGVLHLGISSGLCMAAILSEKPYYLVKDTFDLNLIPGCVERQDTYYQYVFATPHQRMTWLAEDFAAMSERLETYLGLTDAAAWRERIAPVSGNKRITWLK